MIRQTSSKAALVLTSPPPLPLPCLEVVAAAAAAEARSRRHEYFMRQKLCARTNRTKSTEQCSRRVRGRCGEGWGRGGQLASLQCPLGRGVKDKQGVGGGGGGGGKIIITS